jgi:sialic acid synthase SpsE
MLKKLELSDSEHRELIEYCKERKIRFLSTAFDSDSVDLLNDLGLKLFKIPSGEITNLPYLRKIARLAQEIILSSGMSTMDEIRDALNIFTNTGIPKDRITVLHCNTEYPTPFEDVNLNAMLQIKNELGVNVGYSDHTSGIEVPIAAVALGAKVIEKHFTLDKNMEGPDHKASLKPSELKDMVSAIRNIEKALGSGLKEPSNSELKNKVIARKSIHIAKSLGKGHILMENDLIMKRPGNGISPMEYEKVINKKTKYELESDHLLCWNDLE